MLKYYGLYEWIFSGGVPLLPAIVTKGSFSQRSTTSTNNRSNCRVVGSGGAWEAACRTITATSLLCLQSCGLSSRTPRGIGFCRRRDLAVVQSCSLNLYHPRTIQRSVQLRWGTGSLRPRWRSQPLPDFVDLVFLNLGLAKRTGSSDFDGTTSSSCWDSCFCTTSSSCRNSCFCRTRTRSSGHLRPPPATVEPWIMSGRRSRPLVLHQTRHADRKRKGLFSLFWRSFPSRRPQ
jgi:hypothetical protein